MAVQLQMVSTTMRIVVRKMRDGSTELFFADGSSAVKAPPPPPPKEIDEGKGKRRSRDVDPAEEARKKAEAEVLHLQQQSMHLHLLAPWTRRRWPRSNKSWRKKPLF